MTVGEAQERMGSAEFTEWMALATIEPFGEDRSDWRAGMIASVIANSFSEDGAQYQPADFMIRAAKPDAKPQTASQDETREFLKAMGAVRVPKE